jgi:peptidoglycan/xylan/chitin deacetylase (PgdA/CDA1 family)
MTHHERIHYTGFPQSGDLLSRGLPIFTYHKIDRRPWGAKWRSLYLSPARFARQMHELAEAGYTTARLSDPRPASGNAARKFVITFDDGYANVAHHAAPVLRQHGFSAIQFIVANRIGGVNTWDVAEGEVEAPLMDQLQIREWLAAGHEIGSHTLTHPRLTRTSDHHLREEIQASKYRLEDRFGVPVRHFCYPYGDYDERVLAMVYRAGYETASTHLQSGVNLAATPPLEIRRIEARYPKRNARLILSRLLRWSPKILAHS